MTEFTTHCDVLVVGAGPAGLTAAITLARHGIDVLVVERHQGTSPFPKATGISTRSMELFRSWGIEEQIRAAAMAVRPVLTVSHTLAAGPFHTMPFGYPSDEAALAVSPCTPCYCAQDHLEPVLLAHLRGRGGRVRFGVEVTEMTDTATGVRARLRNRTDGRMEVVRADYLIGADGPRSGIRQSAGIEVDDLGTIGEFVAVTFRADLAGRLQTVPGALNAIEITGAEGLFVPTNNEDRWIFARDIQLDSDNDLAIRSPAALVDLIRTAAGMPDLDVDVTSVMTFVMGGHVAQAFSRGRVFLVGDAAHRTTPVGGIGMNTAIHAAHNLGWKLAWVLRGWAGTALLDSYEQERRPIGTQNVLSSLRRGPAPDGAPADGLGADLGACYRSAVIDCSADPDAAGPGQVNSGRSARAAGEVARFEADRPVAAGERAPHAWVRNSRDRVSTLDLLDGRFTVLRAGGDSGSDPSADLAEWGIPIAVLTVGTDLLDEDGALWRRYRLAGDEAVLVRPDGFVAWRGAIGEDGRTLRSAIRQALGGLGDTGIRLAS